jgi:hypothetical protein
MNLMPKKISPPLPVEVGGNDSQFAHHLNSNTRLKDSSTRCARSKERVKMNIAMLNDIYPD